MSAFRRGAYAFAALALCQIGCETKKTPVASAPSGMPPLSATTEGAAPPADHPVHDPVNAPQASGDNALPAGHPPLNGLNGSAQNAAPPGNAAFQGETPGGELDPKTVLTGVLKLDPKVKAKVQTGDTIFVVARKYEEGAPPGTGTPLAVKKLTVGTWPLAFSLDSRDAMLVGTKLEGKVIVTARVDKDGDAISKNPGDVTGQSKPVEPPQKNLVVPLDNVL